jgi:hypothetical protein
MSRRAQSLAVTLALACGPAPAGPETTSTSTTAWATTELASTSTTLTDDVPHEPDLFESLACDPFAQDCPPGQKCAPYAQGGSAWNATKCVDVTGDGGPGDPCTAPEGGTSGIDDCGPGWFCWEVAVDDQGYCVALCTGSIEAPACEVGYQCAFFGDAPLCLIRCDPLMQICLGETCLPYEDGFICVGDESGDAGQANDPCAVFNACDPGLVCLPPETASSACDLQAFGCCQPYCQLPDGTCPNPDQQCLPWYDPMMPIAPGYEDVGICSLPS